jgi:Ala-tRNA(Pro) deacylase
MNQTIPTDILSALDALNIRYFVRDHAPVYTIADMLAHGLDRYGEVPKNLFLRDASGKRHFLIVMHKDKTADLAALRGAIGCSRLGFASPERLHKHLLVEKGAVTPLAARFDKTGAVCVYVDRALLDYPSLGVHAGVNTKTVWLSPDDLLRYLRACGHEPAILP